jgi:hypothetical protein
MSEGTITTTPSTTTQPAAETVTAPAKVDMTSDQLRARLGEERSAGQRELLKRFKFEKPEDLEARLKRLDDIEKANLSEKERVDKRIQELEPQAQRAKTLEERASREFERRIANLQDEKKAKLLEKAGDSLDKRLEYLDLLEDMGTLASTTATTTTTAPPPATTAGGTGAPRPTAAMTSFEQYEDIKKRMGTLAGEIFYRKNELDIERTRPAT